MLQIQLAGDATVIRVLGDLDVFSAPSLTRAIAQTESFSQYVVVSLDECTYCDAAGLSVLAVACRRMAQRLRVVLPSAFAVRRAFAITGLDRHLPIASTEAEAVSTISKGRFHRRMHGRIQNGRSELIRLRPNES